MDNSMQLLVSILIFVLLVKQAFQYTFHAEKEHKRMQEVDDKFKFFLKWWINNPDYIHQIKLVGSACWIMALVLLCAIVQALANGLR